MLPRRSYFPASVYNRLPRLGEDREAGGIRFYQDCDYRIPPSAFAKLTGRSLSTFKRDFTKLFETTPEKWLLQKRLEQAHYLILNKKLRPSEAHLEVGFENLSHFSTAFKKKFGVNPSDLQNSTKVTIRHPGV